MAPAFHVSPAKMTDIQHVHVFGGIRGIGRWFVEHIFISAGLAVSIYDIDISSTLQVPPGVNVRLIRYQGKGIVGIPSFGPADAIVLAVPVSALNQTCAALFPHLPDACLVCDMSSIKQEPHAIMQAHAHSRLSLIGAHPLFGPLVSSPVGQTVILTGFDEQDSQHHWLHGLLKSSGFIIQKTTPEQHDEHMLYIQVLTHFMLLTFAKVLGDHRRSMAELLAFKTPPFALLSAFAGRLLGGNALTYANIQRLAGSEPIRTAILQAAAELAAQFAPDSPLDSSVQAIQNLVEPFRGTEISECVAISEQVIESVQGVEQRLFDLAESGTLCGLQRTDTSRIFIGVVQEVSADHILFEERARQIKAMGNQYAVCTSEQVRENYRAVGIAFGKFKRFTLLKRNIRVLADEELADWLDAHVVTVTRDVNVFPPLGLAATFYEQLLPRLLPELVAVSFVEAYTEPDTGRDKITLAVTHRLDITTADITRRIEGILAQIAPR